MTERPSGRSSHVPTLLPRRAQIQLLDEEKSKGSRSQAPVEDRLYQLQQSVQGLRLRVCVPMWIFSGVIYLFGLSLFLGRRIAEEDDPAREHLKDGWPHTLFTLFFPFAIFTSIFSLTQWDRHVVRWVFGVLGAASMVIAVAAAASLAASLSDDEDPNPFEGRIEDRSLGLYITYQVFQIIVATVVSVILVAGSIYSHKHQQWSGLGGTMWLGLRLALGTGGTLVLCFQLALYIDDEPCAPHGRASSPAAACRAPPDAQTRPLQCRRYRTPQHLCDFFSRVTAIGIFAVATPANRARAQTLLNKLVARGRERQASHARTSTGASCD